jgi:bifunctional UDP-N-acetylglucosamine pyrophosphorylase / glucosamine-1-phosphate N-acetyltransferase
MALSVVILAAGQGKRMRRAQPKVLHLVGGKPILSHLIHTALALDPKDIYLVVGYQASQIEKNLPEAHLVTFVNQHEQLGTGHALQQVISRIPDDHTILVLLGDAPLIEITSLKKIIEQLNQSSLVLLSAVLQQPKGYGRIIRNHQEQVEAIIEDRDCTPEQATIAEVNTGIMAAKSSFFKEHLANLKNNNAQKEYYLTDIIAIAVAKQHRVEAIATHAPQTVQGINDLIQLAHVERLYQMQEVKRLMQEGVLIRDPARFDLRGTLKAGMEVEIDVNVIIEGNVVLGSHVLIGPNCILKNVTVGDHTEIKANTMIEDSVIGQYCVVGPFARIRPQSDLEDESHVGNFVEMKKTRLGKKSKVNHLSYLGDAIIGEQVNIGAGTITCNYDGVNKHKTIIHDHAFVGSNTALVAPLEIGTGATIGAGSTITRSAPAGSLTLTRASQKTIEDWQRPIDK